MSTPSQLYQVRSRAKYAGLREGDAHVIRNAGGRASDDAIRSLVISYKVSKATHFFLALFELIEPVYSS